MSTVHIKWYGAYNLESFYDREIALNKGVYAIYRVFGGKESLLYIGKTYRTFLQRISEHNKDWLWNIKGKIKIRIGILDFSNGERFSKQKLADIESLLILWHTPPENTASSVYYRGRGDLEVINFGRRGLVDRKVSVTDLVDA